MRISGTGTDQIPDYSWLFRADWTTLRTKIMIFPMVLSLNKLDDWLQHDQIIQWLSVGEHFTNGATSLEYSPTITMT